MKAQTLPSVHEAELSRHYGKGLLHGAMDAGAVGLTAAHYSLGEGVKAAVNGPGIKDHELCAVLETSTPFRANLPTWPPSI